MKLIPVHVGWNDESGEPHKLTHIEFTDDCEVMNLETDVLDGDPITIDGNAFTIFMTEDHQKRNDGERFKFRQHATHVGNIMWDMLWMTPQECGRFAVYLQRQKHWGLQCAINEISADWRGFAADDIASVLLKAMEES